MARRRTAARSLSGLVRAWWCASGRVVSIDHMAGIAPHEDTDARIDRLASLILGDQAVRRRVERRRSAGGYDPRSVLVLAVVVTVLAALVAWIAVVPGDGSGDSTPEKAASKASSASADTSTGAARPVAERGDAGAADVSAPVGVDVTIGRMTPGPSQYGGATVRVALRNAGTRPIPAGTLAQVVLFVDGRQHGTRDLPRLGAGERGAVTFELTQCPAVATSVTALLTYPAGGWAGIDVDPSNDAAAASLEFAC